MPAPRLTVHIVLYVWPELLPTGCESWDPCPYMIGQAPASANYLSYHFPQCNPKNIWVYYYFLYFMYLGILGVKDPVLEDIGRSGRTSSKSYRNISRNFHRRLSKSGKVLPVKVSMERVWVRQQRPRVRQIQLAYPMIALRDWGELLLNSHPNLMLGGFSLKQVSEYTEMFTRFWTRYQHLDPSHPIYATHPESVRGRCIPFLVHGDEGRGKGKVPILIQSFQMLIVPKGEQTTNISGWL